MSWIWILIRVTGLTAYVLLTLSILAGIIKHIPGKKWRILEFHQAIGQVALVTIGIHAALLIFDQYEPYTIEEIFIPFMASYHPILSAMGTIAAYLLVIVILTSNFMKVIGRSLWKKSHYLVFPVWFLSLVHGLLLGTDSSTSWAIWLYFTSFLFVLGSTFYMIYRMKKNRAIASARKVSVTQS